MNPIDKIRNRPIPKSAKPRTSPLWKGPEVDGITQSLLGRFLVCRERFRLLVVQGLKSREGWNHRTGYGDMWHKCEEILARDPDRVSTYHRWYSPLEEMVESLVKQYPLDREKIEHWYMVCRTQFPIYVDYWGRHPDTINRTPLLQEQVFSVPYQLPSGRVVLLKGKWDSVDLVKEGKSEGIYLQENKTKGDVDPSKLAKQLTFDLQSMFYLVALCEYRPLGAASRKDGHLWVDKKQYPINGVRYNVVRRPLSGGKGTIVRHKATKTKKQESLEHFYGRVKQVILDDPDHYFCRFKVEVSPTDLEKFKVQCLNPMLEQLCDWWEWVSGEIGKADPFDPYASSPTHREQCGFGMIHFRFPYGVYNPLTEGIGTDLDHYLDTGSEVGLQRTDNLFPELTEM